MWQLDKEIKSLGGGRHESRRDKGETAERLFHTST